MRGGNFVVVDWILVKCENIGLHKMIGAGSRGGKLAIRANPLVRQSLPNLRHQWSLASQLWWWRGGPELGARRALGGLRVQHGEPGQPEDGGESGERLDDGEGEKAG